MTRSRASTPAGRRRVASRTGKAVPPARKPAKAATGKPAKAGARRPARPAKPRQPTKARKRAPSRAARPATPRRPRQVAAAGPSLVERLPSLPRLSFPSIPAIRLPRPSLAGLRELRFRRVLVIVAVALAGLFAFYFGWFRDSSLVSVKHVTVNGVTTPDGEQVVAALTDAAKGMSTLHVDQARLEGAVSEFPTVAGVSVDPSFPSGMTITVAERPPALIASDGKSETPVAADGTILTGVQLPKREVADLPVLKVNQVRTSHLEGSPLSKALVIGAAPEPLRPLIDGEKIEPDTGVVVTMKGGFRIEFGSSDLAVRKWAAAAAVLADPKLRSLTYIDVRLPQRPAVGGS